MPRTRELQVYHDRCPAANWWLTGLVRRGDGVHHGRMKQRMPGRDALRAAAVILLAAMLALVCLQSWAQADDATADRSVCALESGPTRAVTGVIDGETVVLDDGTEVKLVGALAPRPPDAGLDVAFWEPEREAKAALQKLVLSRSVTFGFAGRRTDRYGRTLAHAFVAGPDGGELQWVQAAMLAAGHARAYVLRDSPGCLRELAAHEAIARSAATGLWSHAAYHVRDAGRTADLMRLRSTFQIVEGEVTAVIQGKSTFVLRFGPEGAGPPADAADEASETRVLRGFSLAIKPAVARAWAGKAGLSLDQTLGRRLRVRGWIERRGGPAIDIIDPHQIELVEDGAAHVVASADADAAPAPRRRSRRSRREAAAIPAAAEQAAQAAQ